MKRKYTAQTSDLGIGGILLTTILPMHPWSGTGKPDLYSSFLCLSSVMLCSGFRNLHFSVEETQEFCQTELRPHMMAWSQEGTEHAAAELIRHLLSPLCAHHPWEQRLCASSSLVGFQSLCLGPTSSSMGFSAATSQFHLEAQLLPPFFLNLKEETNT